MQLKDWATYRKGLKELEILEKEREEDSGDEYGNETYEIREKFDELYAKHTAPPLVPLEDFKNPKSATDAIKLLCSVIDPSIVQVIKLLAHLKPNTVYPRHEG